MAGFVGRHGPRSTNQARRREANQSAVNCAALVILDCSDESAGEPLGKGAFGKGRAGSQAQDQD